MALPSIILLLAFVGGVFAAVGMALVLGVGPNSLDNNPQLGGMLAAVSAAIAAGAAWLHWKRFRVPITVAAGAASVAGHRRCARRCGAGRATPKMRKNLILGFVLLLGIGAFLFAMWWDAPTAHASRAARTSPSGSTCWQRR